MEGGKRGTVAAVPANQAVNQETTDEQITAEALNRSKTELRPVEFILPCSFDHGMRQLWAWPDGAITKPEGMEQRLRNIEMNRPKHGEVFRK